MKVRFPIALAGGIYLLTVGVSIVVLVKVLSPGFIAGGILILASFFMIGFSVEAEP